jgi:hypothetical protein
VRLAARRPVLDRGVDLVERLDQSLEHLLHQAVLHQHLLLFLDERAGDAATPMTTRPYEIVRVGSERPQMVCVRIWTVSMRLRPTKWGVGRHEWRGHRDPREPEPAVRRAIDAADLTLS